MNGTLLYIYHLWDLEIAFPGYYESTIVMLIIGILVKTEPWESAKIFASAISCEKWDL